MTKRIISAIIIFTLLNSILLFPGFGASNEFSDEYKNAKDVLLSVCPDMPIGSDGTYTRAEFAAAAVKLLNMPTYIESAGFLDVPQDHKYISQINAATAMGLVNSQNMFYPDSPITYAQAIKIAVTAIGYGVRAELMGAYPAGYIMAAREAKIGRDLNLANDAALSYAEGASILYDMVTSDMLQMTTVGDRVEYSVAEGENILYLHYGIKMTEGIVDSNEFTGLYSKTKGCSKGRITIDGKEYNGADFYHLIGQRIRAFYKDDRQGTIVWAYPVDNKAEKFPYGSQLSLNGNKLSVLESEKDDKADIYNLDTYTVIYNGRYLGKADCTPYINPKAGDVTIVDNNGDGKYDVILIEKINYGFIEKVNVLGKRIYDKYKDGNMVDLSDPDTKYYIYDTNGSRIELEDIEPNTVAGYVIAEGGSLVKIYLYDKQYGGTIEEKSTDGKIKVRDNFYTISEYYSSIKSINKISLGTEVICYLGANDDIVYLENIASEINYGVIIDAAQDAGIKKSVKLKLMTGRDGVAVLDLADKISFNGTIESKSDVFAEIETIKTQNADKRAIKYSLNDKGQVSKLYTSEQVVSLDELYEGVTEDSRPKAFISHRCYSEEGMLTPYIYPTGASLVIVIPKEADKLEEDIYRNVDTTYFTNGEKNYDVIAFDVDESGVPALLLVYTAGGSGDPAVTLTTPYMVVEKVYTTVNEDGDVVECIKGFMKDGYISLYVTDSVSQSVKDSEVATLEPGDIIRVTYNHKNEVEAIEHDFDISKKSVIGKDAHSTTGVGLPVEYINGYIYGLSENRAMVVPSDASLTTGVAPSDSIIVNIARGTTIFVKLNTDRSGDVIDAEIYTEPDFSMVETWRNAGAEVDYLVARQRYRQSSLNVIYVNLTNTIN